MAYLNNLRDAAISKISQGKQEYMAGSTLEAKTNGYNSFKTGIQELLSYAKMETNESLRQITTDKIKGFFTECEAMKTYLSQHQVQVQNIQTPPQNQQNKNIQKSSKMDEEKKDNSKLNQGNSNSPDKAKPKEQTEEQQKLQAGLESAIVTEKPNVKWDDVAGLENAKKSLQEAVILPMKFPEIFQGARKPWMGILLYGPPGTGKTFLAKACATECDGTFFSVSSSDLISKFVGESERLIKNLFQMARDRKPSIIFIDEIDSMTGSRDGNQTESSKRVMTEFLVQMQGVGTNNEGVLVLGATNLPWGLDPAIRRRFERRIYIPLPDEKGRQALLRNRLQDTPCEISEEEMAEIVEQLEGFSGSDINTLIRDASFEPLRKCERAQKFKTIRIDGVDKWTPCNPSDPQGQTMKMMDLSGGKLHLPALELDDFLTALPRCKPSVGQGDLKRYVEWTSQFGQDG